MRNRKVLLVLPLLLFLAASGCSDKSIENAIKATAAVAATNRAAADLMDVELAAGRVDKPTRDAALVAFKEVARLDDDVLTTLEQARALGFLSAAARQSVVTSVNLMSLRISAGTFPFIKNEKSRVEISAKINAITDTLNKILLVLPAAKETP